MLLFIICAVIFFMFVRAILSDFGSWVKNTPIPNPKKQDVRLSDCWMPELDDAYDKAINIIP